MTDDLRALAEPWIAHAEGEGAVHVSVPIWWAKALLDERDALREKVNRLILPDLVRALKAEKQRDELLQQLDGFKQENRTKSHELRIASQTLEEVTKERNSLRAQADGFLAALEELIIDVEPEEECLDCARERPCAWHARVADANACIASVKEAS
jgi:hypothetical protein